MVDIGAGFQDVKSLVKNDSTLQARTLVAQLLKVCTHVEQRWINTANIGAPRLFEDDNNAVEGFHAALRHRIIQRESKKSLPEVFWHFFPNGCWFSVQIFTCLLYVPNYARLQIFIQLLETLTKLCSIKRDHPVHIICSKCPTVHHWPKRTLGGHT